MRAYFTGERAQDWAWLAVGAAMAIVRRAAVAAPRPVPRTGVPLAAFALAPVGLACGC